MQGLVKDYLGGTISRRSFIRRSTAAGFSVVAARSAIDELQPIVNPNQASTFSTATTSTTSVTGTGGELLAEQLRAAGVRFVFVCNSSGMGSLCDAIVDRPDLQFIQGISENQAVAMADGYAKATGETTFACFSRVGGPLASANMYNAMKDRTPVVILTDHMDSQADGRDGPEDLDDWLDAFKQYTKWRWLVKEGNRIPEWVAHAFKVSSTAPCGPTFVRVPRNVLYQSNLKAEILSRESLSVPMDITPNPKYVERAAQMLIESKNPMRFPAPIDLFLNFGAQMPDPGSGPPTVSRTAKIIDARVDSRQPGADYPVNLSLIADVKETARALIEALNSMATKKRLAAIKEGRWAATRAFTEKIRQSYLTAARDGWDEGPLTWPRLLVTVNEMLDEDAIIVEEVGTEEWVLRSFPFADGKKTKIGRTLGRSLCWGMGASIGVKLARPNKQVVSLQGDGGFLFGQSDSLWAMSRYDVPIITIVCNNRSYDEPRNNILMKGGRSRQENKDMICYLGSPDVEFTHLAAAYGIQGQRRRGCRRDGLRTPHANLNLRVSQVFADEVNEEFEPGAYVSSGVTCRNPRRKEELQKAREVLEELAAGPRN